MNEREIREKIADGHIHVRVIVEIVGKPKEYVEETLKGHLKNIKADKSIIFVKEEIEPAEKSDDYFSSFAELEILLKNPNELLSFCFDYMPSSVEIIEPERLYLNNQDFSQFLNDMQARLHAVNTTAITVREKSKLHIKNTAVLMRNFIVVMLSSRPMTLEELLPFMGVRKEDIIKVLDVLIKEGKVKKEGDKYRAVPK
ncbi:hypothetical protein JXC34_02115 [Candidatus Woesearchaeota archaeon]|nr:hypothetical protein [Candidatus Woesearchaeota archaeon]